MSRMYSSFSTKHSRVNGLSPLDRKTPRNPKYAGVRSTLDTGASLSKVDIITNRQYLNRKGELFKRDTEHRRQCFTPGMVWES